MKKTKRTATKAGLKAKPRERTDGAAREAAELASRLRRKEPQEQSANSMEQEEQRSTGMSGQSSGV
jgi:hypothetical protein